MPNINDLPKEAQEYYLNLKNFIDPEGYIVLLQLTQEQLESMPELDFSKPIPNPFGLAIRPFDLVMESTMPGKLTLVREMIKAIKASGQQLTIGFRDNFSRDPEIFKFLLENDFFDVMPKKTRFDLPYPRDVRLSESLLDKLYTNKLNSEAILYIALQFIFEREASPVPVRSQVIARAREAGLPEAMFSGKGDLSKIISDYFSKEGKEIFKKYFYAPHPDEFYEELMDIVRREIKQKERHDNDSSTSLTTQFEQHRRTDSEPAGSAAETTRRHLKEQDDKHKRHGRD